MQPVTLVDAVVPVGVPLLGAVMLALALGLGAVVLVVVGLLDLDDDVLGVSADVVADVVSVSVLPSVLASVLLVAVCC